MADTWFAECLPCKWEEKHDSQLGAIEAATDHVFASHRDVIPQQRAALKMGHVQLRGDESPPAQPQLPLEPTPEPAEPKPDDTITEPEPAESSTPEEPKPAPAPDHGRQAEAY